MAWHPPPAPFRGQVWGIEIPNVGLKPALVISNNTRNGKLNDVVVVRLTTAQKPQIPSVIPLTASDAPLVGSVLCDDINAVPKTWFRTMWGAISQGTMVRVEDGIKHALRLQ